MQLALGHFAKSINKLDQLRGSVFERRFAEIVILDHEALAQRIAYAINNPVEANLVTTYHDWLGLCLFAHETPQREAFTVFNESRYRQECQQAEDGGASLDKAEFYETRELEIAAIEPSLAVKVAAAVEAREEQLQRAQPGAVGMSKVLAASPLDRPKISARSGMPLCFASTRKVRSAFKAGWHAFVAAFRSASTDFRAGVLDVVFPPFTFRPISACG